MADTSQYPDSAYGGYDPGTVEINGVGSIPPSPSKIKTPAPTTLVPNPLNKYASYSYAWSLWWLSISDYNNLMDTTDVDSALAWNPGPTSYVIAEDSGLYPDRRLPGVLPVNYNIQTVNFTTIIAPNKQTRSSNMIEGNMTILEPYGVTFVDTLCIAASTFSPQTQNNNFTSLPYMLQLDFFGYDDNGNSISDSDAMALRKRFPITLTGLSVEVSGQGAEYKLDFCPLGHQGHRPEKATLPKDITITAGTVKEFFYNLESTINGFYQVDAYVKNNASIADSIHFDIDPAIANSKIVYSQGVPLSAANPGAKDIDLSKSNFSIKAKTSILAIIDRTLAQSEFLISQLADAGDIPKIENSIFNAYRTTTSTKYQGVDQGGNVLKGVFDASRNTAPTLQIYRISQHPTWKAESPHGPTASNSVPYTAKEYNYLYTGKNVDVLDFKLSFDMTYYTSVLGYTSSVSSTQTTADTGTDIQSLFKKNVGFNPALLLKNIPNISPQRYRYIVGDQNLTLGGGVINNPQAQKAGDMIKSIYSSQNGDMITIDLKILGDPMLIKQDDWLYAPSPNSAQTYNNWTTTGQDSFAISYGHLRMDAGDIIVKVNINSPIDIDTESGNQGLVYPQMGVNNQYQSLFSGQYRIITIENRFASGKFEQTLQLVRIINDQVGQLIDLANNSGRDGAGAVEKAQQNQSPSGIGSTGQNEVQIPIGR